MLTKSRTYTVYASTLVAIYLQIRKNMDTNNFQLKTPSPDPKVYKYNLALLSDRMGFRKKKKCRKSHSTVP